MLPCRPPSTFCSADIPAAPLVDKLSRMQFSNHDVERRMAGLGTQWHLAVSHQEMAPGRCDHALRYGAGQGYAGKAPNTISRWQGVRLPAHRIEKPTVATTCTLAGGREGRLWIDLAASHDLVNKQRQKGAVPYTPVARVRPKRWRSSSRRSRPAVGVKPRIRRDARASSGCALVCRVVSSPRSR